MLILSQRVLLIRTQLKLQLDVHLGYEQVPLSTKLLPSKHVCLSVHNFTPVKCLLIWYSPKVDKSALHNSRLWDVRDWSPLFWRLFLCYNWPQPRWWGICTDMCLDQHHIKPRWVLSSRQPSHCQRLVLSLPLASFPGLPPTHTPKNVSLAPQDWRKYTCWVQITQVNKKH